MTKRDSKKKAYGPSFKKKIVSPSRRRFVAGAGAAAGISAMEWLGFFRENGGIPGSKKDWGIASARAQEDEGPRGGAAPTYLIYWHLEGGWNSYSMFSPVNSPNHSQLVIPNGELYPSPGWGDQVYRVSQYENNNDFVTTTAGIRHGYLADDGADLIPDMSVLSSHYGDTFHSRARLEYHYGTAPGFQLGGRRGDSERSVLQAFAEAKGASFLLPHVSWHRWLSDGELDPNNYPVGTGYYEQLGPVHAHTVYGKTPNDMRSRLAAIGDVTTASRRGVIRQYTDRLHNNFIQDRDGQSVRSFASAVEIYRSLSQGELQVDIGSLFRDPELREEFQISGDDEELNFRSINGNPARSKECPHTRVQAMMTFELMRANVSNAFWIESRDVRGFDDHRNRRSVMQNLRSLPDQKNKMNDNLWQPLRALVNRLKTTEVPGIPGLPMWNQTTIVLTSEMGRTLRGDVAGILAGGGNRYNEIMEQDVHQHWDVSSAAFMGGNVQRGQFGAVGTNTLDAIPLMPDGTLDPAYNPLTGAQNGNRNGIVPDAGHVYSTALKMAGVDPTGIGLNDKPALDFMIRNGG